MPDRRSSGRGLDAARRHHDRRRVDAQPGALVAGAHDRVDAGRAAVLGRDALDEAVHDEARAGRGGVLEVGAQRRALAALLAAGVAVAAEVRVVVQRRVARDRVVREAAGRERLDEDLGVAVEAGRLGVHAQALVHAREEAVELLRVQPVEALGRPLGAHVVGDRAGDHRVDDGPAAERGSGEQAHRAVVRPHEPAAEVHRGALRLELAEVRLVAVPARLEHEDRPARLREARGDDGAARAGADDADVGGQDRVVAGHALDRDDLRRLLGRRRRRHRAGEADDLPRRIAQLFVEGAEELAEDHGLELLEREAAGGHVVPGAPEALGAGVERGVGEALGRELLQEAAHGARHVGRQVGTAAATLAGMSRSEAPRRR